MSTDPTIELSGLTLSFSVPVLQDLHLRIPSGCLYGLVGPGASGKSVLLKCIAGLLPPDRGSVRVFGQEVTTLDEDARSRLRQRMGMVFQNNALFDFMNVAENVGFPLRQRGMTNDLELQTRVAQRLAGVGLAGFEQRSPAGLSGGQKKRVGVARATVATADLLLYDEPAAGLDPVTSQRIFDLLRREQRASGATVVMVSSDLDRLLPIVDRVGVLLEGRLAYDGDVAGARGAENEAVRQFINASSEGPL